ncbi:hypothetical protein [Phascolarctobacterium faecium]|jgi:hypothetical protein|uniref:hypothetical protein n=1 Tax=Phascolarctobacterium faecium TaxID=33025 RepID=UPI003AEF35C5
MENSSKIPDRINTTKKVRELIQRIDDDKYFELQDNSITRSELFLFAMAIGSETSPTELKNINSGGLVLEKSIDDKTKALMYALFIDKKINDDNLDLITNKSEVYKLAQEYANTGFENIESYMENNKDIELVWELIKELDDKYDKLFGKI